MTPFFHTWLIIPLYQLNDFNTILLEAHSDWYAIVVLNPHRCRSRYLFCDIILLTFPLQCIKTWNDIDHSCPQCRQHMLLPEDYPKLGS